MNKSLKIESSTFKDKKNEILINSANTIFGAIKNADGVNVDDTQSMSFTLTI